MRSLSDDEYVDIKEMISWTIKNYCNVHVVTHCLHDEQCNEIAETILDKILENKTIMVKPFEYHCP